MVEIYQAPATVPGEVTLLATRETWESVKAALATSRVTPAIATALSRPGDGPVRVTLPPETAAAVLRLAATLG